MEVGWHRPWLVRSSLTSLIRTGGRPGLFDFACWPQLAAAARCQTSVIRTLVGPGRLPLAGHAYLLCLLLSFAPSRAGCWHPRVLPSLRGPCGLPHHSLFPYLGPEHHPTPSARMAPAWHGASLLPSCVLRSLWTLVFGLAWCFSVLSCLRTPLGRHNRHLLGMLFLFVI